jgi:hypothetical protein
MEPARTRTDPVNGKWGRVLLPAQSLLATMPRHGVGGFWGAGHSKRPNPCVPLNRPIKPAFYTIDAASKIIAHLIDPRPHHIPTQFHQALISNLVPPAQFTVPITFFSIAGNNTRPHLPSTFIHSYWKRDSCRNTHTRFSPGCREPGGYKYWMAAGIPCAKAHSICPLTSGRNKNRECCSC